MPTDVKKISTSDSTDRPLCVHWLLVRDFDEPGYPQHHDARPQQNLLG